MVKAVVLGAAGLPYPCLASIVSPWRLTYPLGGIGQPLALLLKANPLISEVWAAQIQVNILLIHDFLKSSVSSISSTLQELLLICLTSLHQRK